MFDRDSRTEQPTPRRRTEARDKGSVARSQDLNSAVLLLGAALTLKWFGSSIIQGLGEILKQLLSRAGSTELGGEQYRDLLTQQVVESGKVLLPFLLALLAMTFRKAPFRTLTTTTYAQKVCRLSKAKNLSSGVAAIIQT